MDSREFNVSRNTSVRVFNNLNSLSCGLVISKHRADDDRSHVRLTAREWKTFQNILPTLVDGAMGMHREIVSGKTPVLRETRHILSSRLMTMLSIYRSRTEGVYVIASLCPYEQRDGVDLACFQRGVTFSFDELLSIAELSTIIGKYISRSLSTSKVIYLNELADVIAAQAFIQNFYEDGEQRVRIFLEKPQRPASAPLPSRRLDTPLPSPTPDGRSMEENPLKFIETDEDPSATMAGASLSEKKVDNEEELGEKKMEKINEDKEEEEEEERLIGTDEVD